MQLYINIKKNIILFFLSIIVFESCGNKKNSTNVLIEKYNNGAIKSKMPYKVNEKEDSILTGQIVFYYSNGNIRDSFTVINGSKNGNYYTFDSIGNLITKKYYKANQLNGYLFYYYPNGQIENQELYRNDSMLFVKTFYLNGRLESFRIIKSHETQNNMILDKFSYSLEIDSSGNIISQEGDSLKSKTW